MLARAGTQRGNPPLLTCHHHHHSRQASNRPLPHMTVPLNHTLPLLLSLHTELLDGMDQSPWLLLFPAIPLPLGKGRDSWHVPSPERGCVAMLGKAPAGRKIKNQLAVSEFKDIDGQVFVTGGVAPSESRLSPIRLHLPLPLLPPSLLLTLYP